MRLFIAITLPPVIKRQLADYARALGALDPRARLTREENFHLTLAFLGEALDAPDACAAMDAVSVQPFKLYSDKPGCFKRGGDIFWLGLKSSAELTALQAALSAALQEQGFRGDNRPFAPHITLARQVRGTELAQLPTPRFIVPVGGITLMNSERINGILTYSPLYQKRFMV